MRPGMYAAQGRQPYTGYAPNYGTTVPSAFEAPEDCYEGYAEKSPFVRRRRSNIPSVFMSLFLPWMLFFGVTWLSSFSTHYNSPRLVLMVNLVLLVLVLGFGWSVFSAWRRSIEDQFWPIFTCTTSLLALSAGALVGNEIYFNYMRPYYDIKNLNHYPAVDPSVYTGNQLMDAGRIEFTSDSRLDISKSMGFKNFDTYCVAPVSVTNGKNIKERVSEKLGHKGNSNSSFLKDLDGYDFWAVGINCCSGHLADFHCGEFNNADAKSAVRLMRDDQQAYFRLAVQQAEAAYNIQAKHPIFLHWMMDSTTEINGYLDDGYKYFLEANFSFFATQLLLVVLAAVIGSSKNAA